MDNSKNYIAMMTGNDSKKPCCAPLVESLGLSTWSRTGNPSEKVFMTIGIDVDQNRINMEKELCSSSFSEMLIYQNGRRVNSRPSSMNFDMKRGQTRNNLCKNFQTKYSVSYVYQKLHSTVYQSRFHQTTLISIALIKENFLVNVSIDKRLK
jgi:hypothetical protein